MTALRSHLERWAWVPPAVALVVAAVMPLVLTVPPVPRVDWSLIEQRHAEVQAAIDAFPRSVPGWRSTTTAIPAPAMELLRPNAILARRYERIGADSWMDLLVVHCSDVRDMQGHFPPRCYPANGWRAEPTNRDARIVTVLTNGYELPLRIYEFRRHEASGSDEWLRIYNAFVFPNGLVTADHKQLKGAAESYVKSVRGVAQVQVITPGHVPVDTALEDIRILLDRAGSLLDLLRNGGRHDHAESAV